MAMGQYFHDAMPSSDSNEGSPENSKKNLTGGFDCNICLDFVHDPVVTFCGHLFCWPCIYKWFHCQSATDQNPDDHQQSQCPVCKSEVSHETLVPLYGRGLTTQPSEAKAPNLWGIVIPRRPSTPRCGVHARTSMLPAQQLHYHDYQEQPHPNTSFSGSYGDTPMLRLSSTTATDPMAGIFGELIYFSFFGSSGTSLYTYPNSDNVIVDNNPRFRRHVREADKSLGRVCFFLCCCMVLCLLLF